MSELIRGTIELGKYYEDLYGGQRKMSELIGGTSELWGFVWERGKNE